MNAEFERATAGYDDEHERTLVDAILKAIVDSSKIGEPQEV
jgi:hypothetical protein